MSHTDSDIAFKIEEKVIPAHKSVLIKKSRYFENVFKSGMAESRQDVIEIKDCEYEIFKEYLRFIYQGTVDFGDINQVIKLYTLADKYLQEDLPKKCLNYMTYNINIENVYKILDFAYEENILHLQNCCLKFFKDKLTIHNVSKLIKYLLDYDADSKLKLRHFAFNFVLDNFFEIHENENGNMQQIYEDFLIKNIGMDTIPPLARFLSRDFKPSQRERYPLKGDEDSEEDEDECGYEYGNGIAPIGKDLFEKCTAHLKEAAFGFIQENAEIIMTSKIAEDFPNGFFRDFVLYTTRNFNNLKTENQALRNERKRLEPSQNQLDEESHELKKTKK